MADPPQASSISKYLYWERSEMAIRSRQKQMKTPLHSMTLRLSPDVAEAIENRAFERGISQADWIRLAIRQFLVQEHENEMRIARERFTETHRP